MGTTAAPTTHFQLEKGNTFTIDKGIRKVRLGLGWNVAEKPGESFDPDASVFGLVHLPSGKPKFFGDGPTSYAVTYANPGLKKPNGTFATYDEAIIHSGDDRSGGKGEDDEAITIDLSKVQPDVVELAVWVTIYDKTTDHHQNFGQMKNSHITITDVDSGQALCQYKLREEFADATAVQVGSLVRTPSNSWEFQAVGAGSKNTLKEVLDQYS
jgi:tellurium resistance protein TerD